MSRPEAGGERGESGNELDEGGTRKRLVIFFTVLVLAFVVVVLVAFL